MLWPSSSMTCQPKARHFSASGSRVKNVFHEAIELNLVVIHDADEVVELVDGREHRRLPDLAFLHFTIAEDDVGARRAAVQTRRQAPCQSRATIPAKRSRGGFKGRDEPHVRMALIDRAELAQGLQLVLGCVAALAP